MPPIWTAKRYPIIRKAISWLTRYGVFFKLDPAKIPDDSMKPGWSAAYFKPPPWNLQALIDFSRHNT